jgi:hypothetical protein
MNVIPGIGRGGSCDCEPSRPPHFLDHRLTVAVRLSALHHGYLIPRTRSCYSFLLEVETTPRPLVPQEGLTNSVPSSEIELATFRLVVASQTSTLPRFPMQYRMQISRKFQLNPLTRVYLMKLLAFSQSTSRLYSVCISTAADLSQIMYPKYTKICNLA